MSRLVLLVAAVLAVVGRAAASDVTDAVFGNASRGRKPAAFADFNSDKLTDVLVIRDDGRTVEVLLANAHEPIMRPAENLTCRFDDEVTGVAAADFDGDAFMDVLVTTGKAERNTSVFVLWGGRVDGGGSSLECAEHPLLFTMDQPLVLDMDGDMVADLFGVAPDGTHKFWKFPLGRGNITESIGPKNKALRKPHSHAFLDLDGDAVPDLALTAKDEIEIWQGESAVGGGFAYNRSIAYPPGVKDDDVGQSLWLDVALDERLQLLLPVCWGRRCADNSTLFVHDGQKWRDLHPDLKDPDGNLWGYPIPSARKFSDAVTLRGGDFNLDGYPDVIVTLEHLNDVRTVLLENVPAPDGGRTFAVQWSALGGANHAVAGAFFDFYQKGVLDVLLVKQYSNGSTALTAFKNSLDYDANFLKVMVLTGLGKGMIPPYGTTLPGPRVSYFTVTQDGTQRFGCAGQLSQSAHYALQLPYSIFGLGRTPNFVDRLRSSYSGKSRDWLLVIPNSQVVIVPRGEPNHWRMQLFVTPSRTILETMAVLLGTCALNVLIIAGLHLKEKREDRQEKLQEAHRFHFDAM